MSEELSDNSIDKETLDRVNSHLEERRSKNTLGTKAGAVVLAGAALLTIGHKAITAGGEHELPAEANPVTREQVDEESKPVPMPGTPEADANSAEQMQTHVLQEYEKAVEAEDYSNMRNNPGDVIDLGESEEGFVTVINPLLFEVDGKDYVIYTHNLEEGNKIVTEYDTANLHTAHLVDSEGKRYTRPLVEDGAHDPRASEGTVFVFENKQEITDFVQSQAEYYGAKYMDIGEPVSIVKDTEHA